MPPERPATAAPLFRRPILIAASDPSWAARFEAEAARIREALAGTAVRVEHIGSTSVPGLAAKPVIDIQISVSSFEPEAAFLEPLRALGYRQRLDPGTPEHRILARPEEPDADRLRVNVHVCEVGSDWEWRHPAFRDHLRAHRADRDAYERLKRSLAARFGEDIDAYAGAKTAFIRPIEGALRRERGTPAIGTNRPAEVDRRSGRGSGHG